MCYTGYNVKLFKNELRSSKQSYEMFKLHVGVAAQTRFSSHTTQHLDSQGKNVGQGYSSFLHGLL